MRSFLLGFPLAFALTFSVVPTASASAADAAEEEGGALEIEETGITLFDSVFMKVKAIHATIDGLEGRMTAVQDKIAAAVGQPAGTPIQMSIWQLKQTAGGPIGVEMQGEKPTLTLGGAGSAEAKNAIAQINGAAGELLGVVADLQKLPPQVMELVNACKALPAQLNPTLLQEVGMSPLQLPKVAKTLGKNVKAAIATPERVESLVKTTKDMLTGIPQGIAATEPPTAEAVAAKKDSKKASKSADAGGSSAAPAKSGGGATSLAAVGGPVGGTVQSAWTAFQDAEVMQAVTMLGQADADLSRATTVISRDELGALYQTQALVFMVDGNPAAASASVARALMVNPGAAPLAELGPEYAKLHKALAKTQILRQVQVQVTGSGRAWISGLEVAGGSTVSVPKGEHLVQVERNGAIASGRVMIHDGYVLAL